MSEDWETKNSRDVKVLSSFDIIKILHRGCLKKLLNVHWSTFWLSLCATAVHVIAIVVKYHKFFIINNLIIA